MPLVLVREPNQPVRLFEVRSPKVRIGRATDAELQLPHVAVSRQQALLETQPDGTARLTPLSRKNPVLVDGTKLTEPVVLAHGGQCTIGRYRLTWPTKTTSTPTGCTSSPKCPGTASRRGCRRRDLALPTGLRQRFAALDAPRRRSAGGGGWHPPPARGGAGGGGSGRGHSCAATSAGGRRISGRGRPPAGAHRLCPGGGERRGQADPRVLEPGRRCINGTAFTCEVGPQPLTRQPAPSAASGPRARVPSRWCRAVLVVGEAQASRAAVSCPASRHSSVPSAPRVMAPS